jgi:uncharacterized protein YcbK (DUF882 family)
MQQTQQKSNMSRRRFLQGMVLTVPSVLLLAKPSLGVATVSETRSLSFRHLHTNEKLSIGYYANNHYLHESLNKINYFLRDFRSGEEYPMDPRLLDLLFSIQQATGSRGKYEIISGYRSPSTNAMLRGKSKGVAKRSLHMQGKAIDIRLTDVGIDKVRHAAIALKTGGVGIYRKSNFVHLDTGRFRTW